MSAVLTGIDDDFAIVDGTELITLTSQVAGAIGSVVALKGALTQSELALFNNVGMELKTAPWILWDSVLGTTVPRNGDRITTAAGVVWLILEVTDIRTGAYRCLAQQPN